MKSPSRIVPSSKPSPSRIVPSSKPSPSRIVPYSKPSSSSIQSQQSKILSSSSMHLHSLPSRKAILSSSSTIMSTKLNDYLSQMLQSIQKQGGLCKHIKSKHSGLEKENPC